MEEINLASMHKIHFVGIGGISMSAIAQVLLSRGLKVSGSDFKAGALTDELTSLGAEIHIGHRAENISEDTDLVVYTAAISEDNPELVFAKEKKIPAVTRAVFLGELMKHYSSAICVSGTHGKTTTTSLISQILVDADTDPTIMVGGIVPFLHSNLRIGNGSAFLTEACEYTNSFLSFFPTIEVILNIKADHLDFFKDLDDIRHSFKQYISLLPEKGRLIINGEIERIGEVIADCRASVTTFGLDGDFDYRAENIEYDDYAHPIFDVIHNGKKEGRVKLRIPGKHNIYNCLAALAAGELMGVKSESAIASLEKFTGVERRFEFKGKLGGITIIDDYAHHPDEITATLKAAQNYPHKKLWCVFQPHTYTRTKALMDDFAKSLCLADAVVLADIYAARETDNLGISSKDLKNKIEALGKEVYYFPTFDDIENFLLENLTDNDVLITMGAGDVVIIGEKLLGQ